MNWIIIETPADPKDIAEAARETHTRWCDGIDCPLCPVLGKPVPR